MAQIDTKGNRLAPGSAVGAKYLQPPAKKDFPTPSGAASSTQPVSFLMPRRKDAKAQRFFESGSNGF
jgi:hypothetical protein